MPSPHEIPIQSVTLPGTTTTISYRRLGPSTGTPLILLSYFRSTLNWWDPTLLTALSQNRPVIVFNNKGISPSSGEVSTTFREWAATAITLIQALEIPQVDVLGYSMGGCAAQLVALDAPRGLIRKLILAGTMPSQNPRYKEGDMEIFQAVAVAASDKDLFEAFAKAYFYDDEEGRTAAKKVWDRIHAHGDPGLVTVEAGGRQAQAYMDWCERKPEHSYDRLKDLAGIPVLVVNGDNDMLMPTWNSWVLFEEIPQARLIIYEKMGHGFLFEKAELFAGDVDKFLGQ